MEVSGNVLSETHVRRVESQVAELCDEFLDELPFHGWTHIAFVRAKALDFAARNGADCTLVELAALVHDVNYIVKPGSSARDGSILRREVLHAAGVPSDVQRRVESVVLEAETASRHSGISREAQALSDADTLFKALPITPVLLAKKYMDENHMSIADLAEKILNEQRPLQAQGIYFYDEQASEQYLEWSKANLNLWRCIAESLEDPTVASLANQL